MLFRNQKSEIRNLSYFLPVTSPGEGGISVIWLIGTDSYRTISHFFKSKHETSGNLKPNRLYFGYFYDDKTLVDEVIVNRIPAKESFSGLETMEINSHGGMMPTRKIIECLLRHGVKEINKMELISIAIKNKRLDSIQKEALESLLHSSTTFASRVFMDQFNGPLSKALKRCGIRTLNKLLDSAKIGFALNYPKRILIIGRPNTGKSTLFNTLAGEERVIVHHLPGTTRDIIEETIAIKEIPFILVDTAGWRQFDELKHRQSLVEKIGIKKMKAEIKKADTIICLLDGSKEFTALDKEFINQLKPYRVIWVISKCDLPKKLNDSLLPTTTVSISALKQKGIGKLREIILLNAGVKDMVYEPGNPIIFTHRQYQLAKKINTVSGRSRHN